MRSLKRWRFTASRRFELHAFPCTLGANQTNLTPAKWGEKFLWMRLVRSTNDS